MNTKTELKRGRPPIFSDEHYAELDKGFGDMVATKRGLRNKSYMLGGFAILVKMVDRGITGLDFLIDPNKRRIYSEGILRELALLQDTELAERVTIAICEAQKQQHFPRKRYEAIIRWCRLSGTTDYILAIIKETVSENNDQTKDR